LDAFVYLRVRPGTLEEVVLQLENVAAVRSAVGVVGEWDVLVAVQGHDLIDIAEHVVRGIHRIDGVERTMTAPVVPSEVFTRPGEGSRTPVPLRAEEAAACFVHVRASFGSASKLVETIAAIEEVSAVAMIAGEYDLLVEIPLPWEQAAPVIVNRLLPLDGVEETRTLVAIRFPTSDEEDRDQFSAWS
jgi:DNA-binding Lrp family transcriptional regulator